MARDPGERWIGRISRREFLRRSVGAAVALPSAAAILAACAKPGQPAGGAKSGVADILAHPARPDHPVTLPVFQGPIADTTPIEGNITLQIYNWADYLWPKMFKEFEDKYKQYNVKVELTTFNNMQEAVAKLGAGQVTPDVTFPTVDVLAKLAVAKLLQPLNHSLIPNLVNNYWKEWQNPFYDQGWRYTVPYAIWLTGIGYRRDHVSDAEAAAKGYSLLWDSRFKGKVGIYDSYRSAIGLALLKNGITDVNTGNPDYINTAKEDLLSLIAKNHALIDINGTYAKLPEGEFWVHQAWSGDIVTARYYLPKGVSNDVLGYWYPPQGGGMVGNDTMAIPIAAQHPRLAHEFINFMLDKKAGVENFSWNGYQPPMSSVNPSTLIPKYVPPTLERAIVTTFLLDRGVYAMELTPDVDRLWLDAWQEIQAGA